jgi:arylsulfatase A-like enzyme
VQRPNIIFIIADAVRARNLTCYGYPKPTSTSIEKWAKQGVLFENAFSCTSATDSSLTSIFSGKYPVSHGIISHGDQISTREIRELRATGTTFLPEMAKQWGYVTIAVDWLGRWHKRGYDWYNGVSNQDSILAKIRSKVPNSLGQITRQLMYRFNISKAINTNKKDAEAVTNQAIDLIRKHRNQKFFLFIHYWDAHTPYNPPKGWAEKFYTEKSGYPKIEALLNEIRNPEWRRYLKRSIGNAKTAAEVIAKYDAAIAFMDHQVGRLTEFIDEQGLSNETLIVLTSDHGESLTEHGIYFAHHGLYDVNVHVPLIMTYPGVFPKGKRIDCLIQHVDILPTILHILGDNGQPTIDGKSLIPVIMGEVEQICSAVLLEEAYTQRKRAIRTENFKYIYALSKTKAVCRHCGKMHGDLEELYDLNNDPEEIRNIAEDDFATKETLRSQLLNWIRNLKYGKEKTILRERIRRLTQKTQLLKQRRATI